MTDTPDIEALIAEARGAIQRKMRSGSLGAPVDEISDLLVDRMADALERQQAVVKAARLSLRHPHAGTTAMIKALAALDAPPEGDQATSRAAATDDDCSGKS